MLEELQAAGVYDPGAADAEYRRAIAQHLVDVGLTIEDVIAILGSADPEHEANVRLLFPGPRLDAQEFAARVGMSVEQLDRIRTVAGLPTVDVESMPTVFSARDEASFAALQAGAVMMGEEPLFQFIRVMGSALSQVAEAAVALFGAQVAAPLSEQHAAPDVQFNAAIDGTRALASIGPGLDTLWRFHAETAIRRLTRARAHSGSFHTARLAVGFVDLVGFTPIAAHRDARQLSELVDEFESIAFDVIAQHDARLVKLIGDAVMFTTLDVDAACDIALTLVEQFSDDANPVTPRGALAVGEMLVRGGDYYGPVVNLAARAGDLAVPYEILVSEEVVAAAGERYCFAPAGRRLLKGFDEPAALATLTRGQRAH